MEKNKIPAAHYSLLKNIYSYLHNTLAVVCDSAQVSHPAQSLSQEILGNYKSRESQKESKVITGSLEEIKKSVSTCLKCPLGKRRRQSIEFGTKTPGPVIILTDIPDYYDEIQKKLFTDPVGSLTAKILTALGLDMGSLYITSALKCTSPVLLGSDLEPYKVCLEYLNSELSIIQPAAVLAFGELAYRLIFNEDNWDEIRGKICNYQNVPFVFTHHPRELLHDQSLKKEAWEDLKPHIELFTEKS